jgi:hypothetical protein
MSELSDRIAAARKLAETVGVDRAAKMVGRAARSTALNTADTIGQKVSHAAQSAKTKPRGDTAPGFPYAAGTAASPDVAPRPPGTRRTYTYPEREIVISNVIEVTIGADGGHILRTSDGQEHELKPLWIASSVQPMPADEPGAARSHHKH